MDGLQKRQKVMEEVKVESRKESFHLKRDGSSYDQSSSKGDYKLAKIMGS